jgi:hypothetical protein
MVYAVNFEPIDGHAGRLHRPGMGGHDDSMTLDEALRRLDMALTALEAAAVRRIESERKRSDIETELSLMQDDRARLAVDLDGALATLTRLEAATDDVSGRVDRAMEAVRSVLKRAG